MPHFLSAMSTSSNLSSRESSVLAPLTQLDIGVQGMTCASCVARVERALLRVPGVQTVAVNLATESAHIAFFVEPHHPAASPALLRRALHDAGYAPRSEQAQAEALANTGFDWRAMLPVVLAMALSLPLVLPMVLAVFGLSWTLPAWVQFVLATPVQFVLGARFYRAGLHAIKAGAGNMDLLVALGTTAAWGLSLWLWWSAEPGHAPHLYFEAASVVITLVLLGKWLEARTKHQTTAAIRALNALRPELAHWLGSDGEVDVPVQDLLVDDRIVVRPGERIAADGVVVEGCSQMNESMLTGEPLPVLKEANSAVTGGAINGDGRLVIRVTATGTQSRLARIIKLVEDAQTTKAPVQRLVDQVAAVFVPVVLLIAFGTLGAWLWSGASLEVALINAVTVLVIACPCALGLATPAATMTGTGVAAQHGILIKDALTLELAHRITTVALDKTGTLTVGQPVLSQFLVAPTSNEADLLGIAASLHSGSEHPLALATQAAARSRQINLQMPTHVQAVPGRGTQGQVGANRYYMGSLRWMQELGLDLTDWTERAQALQKNGATVSILAIQVASSNGNNNSNSNNIEEATATIVVPAQPGVTQIAGAAQSADLAQATGALNLEICALLAFSDAPKAGAQAAIQKLKKMGFRTVMLSGDNQGAANAMAQQLGLDPTQGEVCAELLPADKVNAIAQWQQGGAMVAMVGDGINDAPALAAANIGMAMAPSHGGSDVAMHAAGITLMRGDIGLVSAALEIAKRTVIKIRQNLFWAFIYNVAGIPLAALGYLNPMFAGAAMALSSICVMGNALLLRRWKP